MTAACAYRRLGDSLVAFHKYLFTHSPLTSLFYRYNAIGTHGRAEGAAYAFVLIRNGSGKMAFFVDLRFVDNDDTAGTYADAKSAALADIRFEAYHSLVLPFCDLISNIFPAAQAAEYRRTPKALRQYRVLPT